MYYDFDFDFRPLVYLAIFGLFCAVAGIVVGGYELISFIVNHVRVV